MQLTFLGTSAMVPTKERNHSAVLISYGSEGIVVDCGEGTQRQMKIAGIKPSKVTKVLISHWHGDHVLGIPGLVQTLAKNEYEKILEIYGPEGTKSRMENMFKAFSFEDQIETRIHEITKKRFFEGKDFFLEALPLEHNITTLGFSFIEKDRRRIKINVVKKLGIPEGPLLGKLQSGKSIIFKGKKITPEQATYLVKGEKITFIADTLECNNALELAMDSDILVCEATYADDLQEKAAEYKHMTSRQAGLLANKAKVKKLILTHFSQRYKTMEEIENDAKDVFSNTICAYDFMKIKI
ncbi:ribonuclease Z [Candidatus Pacearchaeota archaeon CG1_02_31_27]|nr:MAG: ribonuclease Z [Candidatus Pacearchaeota archaeon CG1_02_31_27]